MGQKSMTSGAAKWTANFRFRSLRRPWFLEREEGQTLPVVLAAMLLGVFFVVPAVTFANSALISQRNAKQALVEQYTADSAITYVMWKLLDPVYSNTPPPAETVTLNGITMTVGITKTLPADATRNDASYEGNQSNVNDYDVRAGHQVWIVATLEDSDTDHNGVYLAYDTVHTPSQVRIPWVNAGPKTYYFHNSPTPPTGNTTVPIIAADIGYDALTMSDAPPTASVLFDFDSNHNSVYGPRPGRWLEPPADTLDNCARAVTNRPPGAPTPLPQGERYRIVWRSPTLAADDTIDGRVRFTWWWGLEDGLFGDHRLTYWICDFDTAKAVKDTGGNNSRNPKNIIGDVDVPRTDVWINPFDLSVTAGSKRIEARVDRVAGNTVEVKSWQLIQN